jgi:SAM-dependent methyltransferase
VNDEPKLYAELASWWPLLSTPADHVEEAELYRRLLVESAVPPPRTVLELGAGGGNNASHLKRHFAMTLVDRSPAMLTVSRGLNPECEHVEGDMRSIRLGRQFDAVFVHDAIMYATTAGDLRQTVETAFVHCRPGGTALFCPDCTRETFRAGKRAGGHDGPGRSLRYFEVTCDPDPGDSTYECVYAYLMREAGRPPEVVHDLHLLGLFAREEWLTILAGAGFQARALTVERGDAEPAGCELFLGVRP